MPRFNVRRVKGFIWLLGTVVLALDGWTFHDVWQKKQSGVFRPKSNEYYGEVLRSLTKAGNQGEVASSPFYAEEAQPALWEARVDGSRREVKELEPQDTGDTAPEVVVEDLSTILDVSLVLYSPDPLSRFAAVTYLAGARIDTTVFKERRLHYAEGEPLLPPYDAAPYFGRVKRIGIQEVVFEWAGEEETLNPGLGREGKGVTLSEFEVSTSSDPSADYATAPEQSVEISDGHWIIGTADLRVFHQNPQRVLNEDISVRTVVPKGGGRSRIQLTKVREHSVVHAYGARKDDQIISVNGFPMTSVPGALNWFKTHPDESQYVVVYERQGRLQTKTFHVK